MKNIAWHNTSLLVTGIAMIPVFALIAAGQTSLGLVLAIGVAIVSILPTPTTPRECVRLPIVGAVVASGLIIGSLLSHLPGPIAALLLGALAFGASYLTSTKATGLGMIAMTFIVPVIAIGLSYQDFSQAVSLGICIALSGAWMAIVMAVWIALRPSDNATKSTAKAPATPKKQAVQYGLVYGVAASVAAIIPFTFGWEHVGWVAGSALLVMRPNWQVEKTRAIGRSSSVAIGAIVAAMLLAIDLPTWMVACVITLAVVLTGATRGSRWYIMPGFMTFIVFFVLLYGKVSDGAIEGRLIERIGEVLIGITIAVIAGEIARYVARKQ